MKSEFSRKLRRKLGQNTAEYLIMLVLISVGSITIFTVFGDAVRKQLSNVVVAFTGKGDMQDLSNHSKEAITRSKKGLAMDGVSSDEVKKYGAEGGSSGGN